MSASNPLPVSHCVYPDCDCSRQEVIKCYSKGKPRYRITWLYWLGILGITDAVNPIGYKVTGPGNYLVYYDMQGRKV